MFDFEDINTFDFEDILDIHEVIFEIYIEDKLISEQKMQAPKYILIKNFMNLAKQIHNDKRPIKIRMIRPEVIFDNFINQHKTLNNVIELMNCEMVAWEEENNNL